MERDSIVIISLHTPREKVWGRLLALTAAGIIVQGIDLNGFDDWVRQVLEAEPSSLPLSTVFYPMHRVERVVLDETSGDIPSVAQRFLNRVGITVLEYLAIPESQRRGATL